jgi:hypothetical protein
MSANRTSSEVSSLIEIFTDFPPLLGQHVQNKGVLPYRRPLPEPVANRAKYCKRFVSLKYAFSRGLTILFFSQDQVRSRILDNAIGYFAPIFRFCHNYHSFLGQKHFYG